MNNDCGYQSENCKTSKHESAFVTSEVERNSLNQVASALSVLDLSEVEERGIAGKLLAISRGVLPITNEPERIRSSNSANSDLGKKESILTTDQLNTVSQAGMAQQVMTVKGVLERCRNRMMAQDDQGSLV
ncbi:hypothetical protein I302_109072 [Kwoniella bestiolae CBS 10118]|uniref:Uncharacterized protein n=1 Tax=Kwoniella bestiolae CBS 10118 TaxID=1296100 RepID=A0A1B9FUW8_9TREE|nr:hypothetical protein I302_08216 [Kwoniella bestiolae CBS 10118]OCF22566.1 hypothetical protein I302_08216 [Kwoniella bestiolae CBS 10118]